MASSSEADDLNSKVMAINKIIIVNISITGIDNDNQKLSISKKLRKLTKSKKPNMDSKKSILIKAKTVNFANSNFSETNFLIFGAKEAFIYL